MNTIPLSLYVHFPWCVRKCPYCDFNSHEASGEIPANEYVEVLIRDLDQELINEPRRQLRSIFMGGGTPSLIPPEAIAKLLSAIRQRFDLEDIEITLEANPGTFDQNNFDGYHAAGVNRISLGAQSFSEPALQALGRIHQPDDITRAFEGGRKAGIERINVDLMHGLPGQDCAAAEADLHAAIALSPEHISWYQLTIEPNTVFHKRPPRLPEDKVLEDIYFRGQEILGEAGFYQYETSAYATAQEQSQHNLNYWEFGDYLGIGAGAHGKLTRGEQIIRTTKSRKPADYLNNARAKQAMVPSDEKVTEFLMNALRLTTGFPVSLFEARTGLSRDALLPFIERASNADLLVSDQQWLCPTELGQRFLTDLLLLID